MDPCTPPSHQMTRSPPTRDYPQQDPCTPPYPQMTRSPPHGIRGHLDTSPVARPEVTHRPRRIFTDQGAEAAQLDPCTPPSHQMTRSPPTRDYPQEDPCTPPSPQMTRSPPIRDYPQQDPCTPPYPQMTRSPPGTPSREYRHGIRGHLDTSPVARPEVTHRPRRIFTDQGAEAAQLDPCAPPSHQMTRSPPTRGYPQQDPCTPPSPQMTRSPPIRDYPQQDPCTPPSQQMPRSPPATRNRADRARPDIEHTPPIVMQNDEFARQCDQLLAQWGGYFTSPQSIGGRSTPQSASSMPSSPGSDRYWATSDEEGFHSAETNMSSNWSGGTRSSPPLSSMESGISTPVLTPSDMSPAPEMLPSAFHATDTNVVLPNFKTILLIIDYLANVFCEDRRQRLNQINCFVTQLTSLQGNELQDSLLTLRDLVIRRGRMLPDLYDYFRALAEELKDIHKKATDRHNPVPNLYKLCELARRQLDPFLSQETYLEIINNLRLFADWAYLRCSHDKHTNDELLDGIEDIMCSPERLEDFTLVFSDLFEESSRSIDIILESLNRSQLQIDKFLILWKDGGEILNKPAPDDRVRIYIQLPNLDIPELEAGVGPGAPVAGTGINAEPLGPPPPPPGYQPLLQVPLAQPAPRPPRPTRSQPPPQPCSTRSGAAAAWDAPGPSGLQSGRFANAPIPGPGMRAAYTSSSDSSPSCPGYEGYVPPDQRLVDQLTENLMRYQDQERDFCQSPMSPNQ